MKPLSIINPYDLSPIDEIPLAQAEDVERAIAISHDLYADRSGWLPAHERIRILENTASIMSERVGDLATLATREGGKPLTDSTAEVHRAIQGVKLAAQNIGQIRGEQIPMDLTAPTADRTAFTFREPIGVAFSISAFNHPLNLTIHQVVPAIAVGSPVIIKPATTTPLSCLNFISILREAGLPDGWCQAVVCGNEHAEALVGDPRVHFLSFIGSGKVGWHLRSKLAPGTRCALEHGGAAPVIVEPDADIDKAVPSLLKGGFYHSGQVCVSVQRIFAHVDIVTRLADKLADGAGGLILGDPLDSRTEMGPLILPREVTRVGHWVDEAVAGGAKALSGGTARSATTYPATVLLEPPAEAKVSTQEIFGPVVCIYSYTDRREAIAKANRLRYAFQAAVFTRDIDTALDTAKRLEATAVMVNDHSAFRADWMPFGGRKESGLGLGGIPQSMHDLTSEKLIVVKQG